MHNKFYTDEKNTQIILSLLKAHGIRRVVANPGTTNISFVGSVQNDSWFEVYSGVDERHSAYMAVGMAAATGEPVVLSCTGATASRNYLSAMTEAYYRKLPILVITSMHSFNAVGQLMPQVLDRTVSPNDTQVAKYEVRAVRTDSEVRHCIDMVNSAILKLFRNGGGPVHVNLEETGVMSFNTHALPMVRKVERYCSENIDHSPAIPTNAKIALFLGSGMISAAWESFASTHNVAVFASAECDYCGPKRIYAALLTSQHGFSANPKFDKLAPDLIIDVGEMSGDYSGYGYLCGDTPVWRVSEDGEVRNRFGGLVAIFDMSARCFVEHYAGGNGDDSYYKSWVVADGKLREKLPDLPFSNPWIACTTSAQIPEGVVMHFGILNSLRSWNLFPVSASVHTASNVGGFGIDGGVSTLIGSSIVRPDVLHFGVFGDLAFFYDLNALGNRHIGGNLRILLVNNGCGSEFNMYFHPGSQFGEQTNEFIAAGGHFAAKSQSLVRNYVTDLGFRYISALNKEEFTANLPIFLSTDADKPIVFECFTDSKAESAAHYALNHIDSFKQELTVTAMGGKVARRMKRVLDAAMGK